MTYSDKPLFSELWLLILVFNRDDAAAAWCLLLARCKTLKSNLKSFTRYRQFVHWSRYG